MLLGYARVSKEEEQDTRMQETALRAAGVERLFTEHTLGGRWDRPALHRMLDQLRPRDVVVVWKLDRLSRSLKDLLHLMERIAAAKGFSGNFAQCPLSTRPEHCDGGLICLTSREVNQQNSSRKSVWCSVFTTTLSTLKRD